MNGDFLRGLLSDQLLTALCDTYTNVSRTVASALVVGDQLARNGLQQLADHLVAYGSPVRLEFSELQTLLLTVFLVIIGVNVLLIAFYWNKYGGVITDRFIRPSTLKEIEELKLSVAKLKLPIEHTPRL